MLLLAKNRLSFCSLLTKIDLVFVTCLQKSTWFLYATKINLVFVTWLAKIDSAFVHYKKNRLGFCNNNHKNWFSFCSSLAKINSIFVPCKNRLDMHKNRIGFCSTQILTHSFILCRNPFSFKKKLQTLDYCPHFY